MKKAVVRPEYSDDRLPSGNHGQIASGEILSLRLPSPSTLTVSFQQLGFAIAQSVLPKTVCSGWRTTATRLAQDSALEINKQGKLGGTGLCYAVVTGETVAKEWLEMFSIYRSPILHEWIRTITRSEDIFQSNHLRSAININILSRGEVYPWHFDAVPYTLILYLSDSAREDGGALQIRNTRSSGEIFTYLPHAGDLILMDGTRCITALRH